MSRLTVFCATALVAVLGFAAQSTESQAAAKNPIASIKIQVLTATKIKVTVTATRAFKERIRLAVRASSDLKPLKPMRVTPKGYKPKIDSFGNYILWMPSLRTRQSYSVVVAYRRADFPEAFRCFTAGLVHKAAPPFVQDCDNY